MEWKTVINPKYAKFQSKKEKIAYWNGLTESFPHIIVPQRGYKIQQDINVDGLGQAFESEEWVELQKSGFVYIKTFKNDSLKIVSPDEDHIYVPIKNNKYNDEALFVAINSYNDPRVIAVRSGLFEIAEKTKQKAYFRLAKDMYSTKRLEYAITNDYEMELLESVRDLMIIE